MLINRGSPLTCDVGGRAQFLAFDSSTAVIDCCSKLSLHPLWSSCSEALQTVNFLLATLLFFFCFPKEKFLFLTNRQSFTRDFSPDFADAEHAQALSMWKCSVRVSPVSTRVGHHRAGFCHFRQVIPGQIKQNREMVA